MDVTRRLRNPPRVGMSLALAAGMLLSACNQSVTTPTDEAKQTFGAPVPGTFRSSSMPETCPLEAALLVDDSDPVVMTLEGGLATGIISGLPSRQSELSILFSCQSTVFGAVDLARADRTLALVEGENRLSFADEEYKYPDSDMDGVTNLGEIRSNTDPFDGLDLPREWGQEAQVGTALNASRPRLAVNGSGQALAVWQQFDGINQNIRASSFSPASGWSESVLVESISVGDATLPQVTIDEGGNGLAIWQQRILIMEEFVDIDETSIWASRYDAATGAWGPVAVVDSQQPVATSPRLAMNAQGVAVAVWVQAAGAGQAGQRIWSARFTPESNWSAAELISSDSVIATDPEISIDTTGNALAAWRQADSGITREPTENLWANRYIANTGWGNSLLIESAAGGVDRDLDIAMDNDGNGMAVWVQILNQDYTVLAAYFDSSRAEWGLQELIESPALNGASPGAFRPDIEFDATGRALAVWQQSDGVRANIVSNSFDPVSGWGDAVVAEIQDMEVEISDADSLAVSPGGSALAIWRQTDGQRVNVWSNRHRFGLGWGTPELLENMNADDGDFQRIGISGNGRGLAVWLQGTSVFENRQIEPGP